MDGWLGFSNRQEWRHVWTQAVSLGGKIKGESWKEKCWTQTGALPGYSGLLQREQTLGMVLAFGVVFPRPVCLLQGSRHLLYQH